MDFVQLCGFARRLGYLASAFSSFDADGASASSVSRPGNIVSRSGSAYRLQELQRLPYVWWPCRRAAYGFPRDAYEGRRPRSSSGPRPSRSSLLLKAVQYGDPDLQMPPRGKIADSDIAAIEKWILELPADAMSVSTRPAPEPLAVKTTETPVAAPKPTTPEAPATAGPPPAPVADVVASKITPEQEQFFESKVRPLLAKNCYSCHTRSASGGLRLDSREAVLKGGKDGVVVVPGHPESSLLISALNYKAAIQMPPSGQLKTEEVAVVEQWIKDGVPWPKEAPAAPARQVTEADRTFWAFHVRRSPARGAGDEIRLGAQRYRPLHPCEARGKTSQAGCRRRQAHSNPPRDLRSYGPSAHAGRSASLPRRQIS